MRACKKNVHIFIYMHTYLKIYNDWYIWRADHHLYAVGERIFSHNCTHMQDSKLATSKHSWKKCTVTLNEWVYLERKCLRASHVRQTNTFKYTIYLLLYPYANIHTYVCTYVYSYLIKESHGIEAIFLCFCLSLDCCCCCCCPNTYVCTYVCCYKLAIFLLFAEIQFPSTH